jgi:hypothetical protein
MVTFVAYWNKDKKKNHDVFKLSYLFCWQPRAVEMLLFFKYTSAGVSKWDGTRYFYPPEIVYSTGRNYWTPKISGGQNHKYMVDRLVEYFS